MSDVIIVDYDPTWPLLFEQEKARLVPLIREYVTEFEHVGSTSVPGLAAKPIIDILGIIRSNALIERCIEPLAGIGYGYMGENGIPGRYFSANPIRKVSLSARIIYILSREITSSMSSRSHFVTTCVLIQK